MPQSHADTPDGFRSPMRRSPRINRISNMENFMRSWDDPAHPKNSRRAHLRQTSYGNINKTGIPGDYGTEILSRWHPQFDAALEPGVKEIVLILVRRFGWITYSSCEGHDYGELPIQP